MTTKATLLALGTRVSFSTPSRKGMTTSSFGTIDGYHPTTKGQFYLIRTDDETQTVRKVRPAHVLATKAKRTKAAKA